VPVAGLVRCPLQKQGGATEDEVREATIRRLEAEIALEQEKTKPTAPSK